jgi:hypothetical protein
MPCERPARFSCPTSSSDNSKRLALPPLIRPDPHLNWEYLRLAPFFLDRIRGISHSWQYGLRRVYSLSWSPPCSRSHAALMSELRYGTCWGRSPRAHRGKRGGVSDLGANAYSGVNRPPFPLKAATFLARSGIGARFQRNTQGSQRLPFVRKIAIISDIKEAW